ncbi:MAG: flagellar motor switch protein FliG [Oscillospiraceae bacterium]
MAAGKELTPARKIALVMASMGAENASNIYKHLSDSEVEEISVELARLEYHSVDEVEEVLNEFYELCLTQKVVAEGGYDYARTVLEKAFGEEAASSLLNRITKQLKTKSFDFVRKADYKNLLAIVQNEHPQTIALILSYARTDQASAILSELPKEKRVEVVERIANMDRASPEVVKAIEESLEKKFASLSTADSMEVGGINYVAEIMNNVDRATEKYIFDELSARDQKLADLIKQKMFVFEDIVKLDSQAIQEFTKQVESKDLAIALKGSTQEVAECIFANISSRARENLQADIEYLHNVRMRDVEEAQQRIVGVIRKLEQDQVITITHGSGDEIIA